MLIREDRIYFKGALRKLIIKPHHRIFSRILICSLVTIWVTGCATVKPEQKNDCSAQWKTSRFLVEFRAGPHNFDEDPHRSFSYYKISRIGDIAGSTRVFQSAEECEGDFHGGQNFESKKYIKIVEDHWRDRILIDEDVPNACAPCKNFILITCDENGYVMPPTYL